jgi:SAM-dependent methyltransferase
MAAPRISGTDGYAEEAETLLAQYESINFADVHRQMLHLIPAAQSRILDVGAGNGRDAAGLAALGHRVLAVEPTAAVRIGAMALDIAKKLADDDPGNADWQRDLVIAHCHRFDTFLSDFFAMRGIPYIPLTFSFYAHNLRPAREIDRPQGGVSR